MIVAAWSDAQVREMLAISPGHLRLLLARSRAAGLPFPGADLGSDGRALRRWTPDLPGLLRWATEVKAWRASASEARATPSDGVTNRGALDAPRLKLMPPPRRSAPRSNPAPAKAAPVLPALQLVKLATAPPEERR